jgi:proton-translocating NADH-quinone oxidoreductase chain M
MVLFYWFFLYIFWALLLLIPIGRVYVRIMTYSYLISIFLISTFLIIIYNKSIIWYQIIIRFYNVQPFYINNIIGIDGFSISLILLCTFLLINCLLIFWFLRYKINLYCLLVTLVLWLLINLFSTLDLLLFYIYFEGIVVPMFLIIGIWGSRNRRIYAAYQFFLYTLLGSILVLVAILSILWNKGTTSIEFFLQSEFFGNRQLLIWMLLFFGFSVKIPIVPLHIWLPEAHVEAPTPGSIILAGILLKLGSYAILRLLLFSIIDLPYDYIIILINLGLISFMHASFTAYGQIDIKKIIAYSSVAHMNFALLGLFSNSILGFAGFYHLMFGHAITSGALFMAIGVIHDRYKTRLILYYSSLVIFMPVFSFIFFLLILSNFGFPCTFNFVGEFLILVGISEYSILLIILSAIAVVYTLYILYLYIINYFLDLFKKY